VSAVSSSYSHPTQPVTITGHGASTGLVHVGQVPHGSIVAIETKATGTLYTVPANLTFSGVVSISAGGSGSVSVSAATGGQIAGTSGVQGEAMAPTSVTVAGGAGGNAISVSTSGAAGIGSVLLVGYVG
jgi:CO dehydrogenase/acetyl-CoA synthase gamma subunit (corrinoid Fe-S protein)